MGEVTVKKIEDVDWYKGDKAIPGMRFRPAGRALGVSAWGMNVIEIDSGCEKYPEHDHLKDGQEEVYVVLRGTATLRTEGGEQKMEAGAMARTPRSCVSSASSFWCTTSGSSRTRTGTSTCPD